MFTGIIEEMGIVSKREKQGDRIVLTIKGEKIIEDLKEGDSVAVNGVCLTVIGKGNTFFQVEVSSPTLKVTNLSSLRRGEAVNLERPLKASDRLSGHIVTGHVDGKGRILEKGKGESFPMKISIPSSFSSYLVENASIAVEGVSLTVKEVGENYFTVYIIPYTAKNTTLGKKRIGELVNIELDIVAKYLRKWWGKDEKVTWDLLKKAGFLPG